MDANFVGVAPRNGMEDFYHANGMKTFRGNFGAVPGAAEAVGPLADNPAWKQPDFGWLPAQ